jgi:hypothetical protein
MLAVGLDLWIKTRSGGVAAAPAAPVNTGLPVITGTPTVGQTISTTDGTWTGSPTPTYTYQWKRAGGNIAGATANTYTLVPADTAALITVTVTATNASGNASATSASFGTINLTPSNAVAPAISGSLTVGSVLTSTTGTWAGTPVPTYAYQWQRDTTNVGTNASTYTLVTADIAAMMTCVVTGTNTAGSSSATSNALGPVTAAAVGGGTALLTGEANGWATDFLHPTDAQRVSLKTSGTLVNVAAGSLAVDYDPVTHAALGLLNELQATNLCLRSDDFTNASWVKTTMTAAKTATGPDGVANSASTLTASAGNATALQAITSGSAARITSVFLKRRTGTGNVQVTQNNGSTWATQTLTSSWARYALVSVTSANPTVGIRIVTSGDAVDVAVFQHEVGDVATSPIPTVAATVTRAGDQINFTPASINFSSTAGSWWVEVQMLTNTLGSCRVIGYTTGSFTPIYQNFNDFRCYESYGSATVTPTVMVGVPHKVAIAFTANTYREMITDGLTPFAEPGANTSLCNPGAILGLGYNPTSSIDQMVGYIRKVRYVPRRKSPSELVAETT